MKRKKRRIHYVINHLKSVIRKQKIKTPWKNLPTGKKATNHPNTSTTTNRPGSETK